MTIPIALPSPVRIRRAAPDPGRPEDVCALGVYGATVITALTAQNTNGVTGIHQVPADFVTAQLDAVFGDLDVKAVKSGWWRSFRRSTPSLPG